MARANARMAGVRFGRRRKRLRRTRSPTGGDAMTNASAAATPAGLFSFLDRAHTVAEPGFSRWMVPPAALCIHLCIGQAYAFSVFNLPMSKLIGVDHAAPGDWKLTDLGWIFSIAIFFLGASAAVFGRWVEDGGPRRAMFASGLCWAGGFFVAAIGVYLHMLWIIYLGYGVLGGVGLGLGLHLAGFHPDQMVPGSSGHGHRHGDHGLRRRRLHRLAAFGVADAEVFDADAYRGRGILPLPRRDLSVLHVGGRRDRARAARELEAGGLRAARGGAKADHPERRLCLRRAEDAAVLADLVGSLPQRHRRHRRARPGFGDEPGNVPGSGHADRRGGLRRAAQPVQHGRALLLGHDFRLYRPQEHLFLLLRDRPRALRAGAVDRSGRQRHGCSCCASW